MLKSPFRVPPCIRVRISIPPFENASSIFYLSLENFRKTDRISKKTSSLRGLYLYKGLTLECTQDKLLKMFIIASLIIIITHEQFVFVIEIFFLVEMNDD